MTLQSEFKNNDQLVACETQDPEHVSEIFHNSGDHVKLIRKALNAWLGRADLANKPPPLDETSITFDKALGDRVFLYKSTLDIRNYQNQIDRIVGRKTVVALDHELPIQLDPVDIVSHFIDIVVKFAGALTDTPAPLTADSVIPINKLAAYKANKLDPGIRKLLRVGHQTISFGGAAQAIRDKMHAEIKLASADSAIGRVFVFGTSSGGRNAIEFTRELALKRVPCAYLAVSDAAFFPQDTATVPNKDDFPTNTPLFTEIAVAGRRECFFQLVGNRAHRRLIQRNLIFSSDMDNKEIHGLVDGFLRHDLSDQIRPATAGLSGKEFADTAHIEASREATKIIHSDIAGVLNSLP